jgi:hypothetical protein
LTFQKNNQLWKLRSKHGRDKIFSDPEILWAEAIRYFKYIDSHPWHKVEQLKQPRLVKDKDGNGKVESIVHIPTARPYTLSGLCLFLGVNSQYFTDFKKTASADFSLIVTRIEEVIYTQKFEGATVGAFNPLIIARDLGLKEQSENKNTNTNYNSEPLSAEKIKEINKALEDDN